MRISDWSSDVCSSDLLAEGFRRAALWRDADTGPFDRSEVHTAQSQLDARDLARRSRHLFRRPLPSMERQRPDRRPVVGSAGASRHRWRVRRSEEHTSELQSLMRISYAVFCLKKKNTKETTKV